jgi:membrane protein DedA with SNARE-associated domain
MDLILTPLLSFVLLYKYVAIFLIIYIAAIMVPLPSNAMLLAIGAFASQGYVNFWIVLATAILGNVLGDVTDYSLTRKYGDVVIKKLRLDKLVFLEYLTEEIKKDATVTIFFTRFAGSLCPVVSLLSGLVKVPFKKFLLLDFVGNFLEQSTALVIGFYVGNSWNAFSNIINLFVAIVAFAMIIFILLRIQKRILKRITGK